MAAPAVWPRTVGDEVLASMLERQHKGRRGASDSLARVQRGVIQPHMRRQLADWMLETSEEFSCGREIFATSVSYLDWLLAAAPVALERFQLMGAACLLIATKLNSTTHISIPRLCHAMDNAYTPLQLRAAELDVMRTLEWSFEVVKPHDFLEVFLFRMTVPMRPEDRDRVRRHAMVFIDMAYTEYALLRYSTAVIAAAALYCAVVGLGTGHSDQWVPVPAAQKAAMLGLGHLLPPNEAAMLLTCVANIQALFLTFDLVLENPAAAGPFPATTPESEASEAVTPPATELPRKRPQRMLASA